MNDLPYKGPTMEDAMRPEPKRFGPFHNPEVAGKIAATFREIVAEARATEHYRMDEPYRRSVDKLERCAEQMERDGWVR